jgi:hypothetical protein
MMGLFSDGTQSMANLRRHQPAKKLTVKGKLGQDLGCCGTSLRCCMPQSSKVETCRRRTLVDSRTHTSSYVALAVLVLCLQEVQVYCQEFEHRTRYIPQTLNPQWNQTLVLYASLSACCVVAVCSKASRSDQLLTLTTGIGLTVQVWDADILADDFMGEIQIQLDSSNGIVSGAVLQAAGSLCTQRGR